MESLKASIIIPTYNRPEDLRDCLRSILKQTVRPYEIIVIDDGELQELPLRQECESRGIACRYYKKTEKRGPAVSRNIGADLAKGNVLFFLDDDVILFSNYLEEIVKVYKFHPQRAVIGGVGGIISNSKSMGFFHHLFHILFLISSPRGGKILPSGFSSAETGIGAFPPKKVTEVDFLPGGVSSFKKDIFQEFRYSEDYTSYSRGEDKEFSYRVSRRYKLFVTPEARLIHKEAAKVAYNMYNEGWDFVMSRYNFFKTHVKESPLHWFYFYYALTAYMLERIVIMALSGKKGERDRVRGIIDAYIFALKDP